MADQIDYSFKSQIDPTAIARLAQDQQYKQAELQRQNRNDKYNMLRQTAQDIGGLISSAIEASKQRQRKDMINSLAASMVSQVPDVMKPQQGPVMPEQPTLPDVSTPDLAGQNAVRRSVQLNPEDWTKQLAMKVLPTPLQIASANLKGTQAEHTGAQTGEITGAMLPNTRPLLEAAYAKAKITPTPGYENMTEKQAQQEIMRATALSKSDKSLMSPLAEVRKAALVDKMNKDLDKAMQPAEWQGTSPKAVAAKLVLNAESAKALADQMLNGQVPANSQTMSVLNTDVARVIGQQGVVTNEGRHELQTETGYAKFADAAQFFVNHPTDRKATAFIKVLKTEMQRQQDLRQKVVDNAMRQNLAAHAQLRRMSPDDWEAGLAAKGIDVEAAKKGHFKLDKNFISQLQPEAMNPDDVKASVRTKLGI